MQFKKFSLSVFILILFAISVVAQTGVKGVIKSVEFMEGDEKDVFIIGDFNSNAVYNYKIILYGEMFDKKKSNPVEVRLDIKDDQSELLFTNNTSQTIKKWDGPNEFYVKSDFGSALKAVRDETDPFIGKFIVELWIKEKQMTEFEKVSARPIGPEVIYYEIHSQGPRYYKISIAGAVKRKICLDYVNLSNSSDKGYIGCLYYPENCTDYDNCKKSGTLKYLLNEDMTGKNYSFVTNRGKFSWQ